MEEAGVQPDRSLMVHAYPGESLEALAAATLASVPPPTAVFCENARVCQSVIKAAGDLKMRIPEDLSVVGYGQNVCEINEPVKITAYVPETARVGEMAVDLVRQLLSDRLLKSEPIIVPGRLVERESVRSL
jgi:DNA-binding LacI/PurR family transcriptional regulator